MLMRLVLLYIALIGRRGTPRGEVGGELAMAQKPGLATKHSRYCFSVSTRVASCIE